VVFLAAEGEGEGASVSVLIWLNGLFKHN
jgi:hypothetical protein